MNTGSLNLSKNDNIANFGKQNSHITEFALISFSKLLHLDNYLFSFRNDTPNSGASRSIGIFFFHY